MKRWVSGIVLLTLLSVAIFSLGKIAVYSDENQNSVMEMISDGEE